MNKKLGNTLLDIEKTVKEVTKFAEIKNKLKEMGKIFAEISLSSANTATNK